MIWTPYDWLNKFYCFCMVAVSLSVVDLAIELKHVMELNLVRLSYHFTRPYFIFTVV